MQLTINERIDLLISMLGLRQDQFSDRIGEDDGYVSEMIEGKREASEELVRKISEKYGINVEWLEEGTGYVFAGKMLNNGKRSFTDCYEIVKEDYGHRLEDKQMMKALKALDVIREGDPISMKEALAVLDAAKDILLDYKMV